MPVYYVIMGLYTALTVYILIMLIWNLFTCRYFWEQVVAFFVILPFLMRVLFIK